MYCGTKLAATRPCATCARPLLASAPKCSFCGSPTGARPAVPTASDVNRARTEIFQTAERLRAKEAFVDALSLYQQVIRADPTHVRAYLGAARCLANLKHLPEAIATLDAVLTLQPDFEEARALRDRLREAPRPERAAASTAGFEDAGIGQMVERAFAFVEAKEWAKALAIFDALLADLPAAVMFHAGNAPVHAYRAICLKRMSRFSEALAAADDAIRSDRGYSLAWANRADILDELGRLDESIASFDEAVRLDPKNTDAWIDRGYVLRKSGRPADALASYDRALALNPRNAIALGNRGHALLDLGRVADAVASLKQALVVDPKQPAALASLQALAKKGLVDAAEAPIAAQAAAPGSAWSRLAEHFARELAKAHGPALDFTPASLRALDTFLDATFLPDEQRGDVWQPREGQKAMIAHAGAYLGEVFRRAAKGAWVDGLDGDAAPYSTGVVTRGPSGDVTFHPFRTAYERFEHGEGALYAAYERACTKAGVRPEGASAADWTRHLVFLAEQRFLEDALACAETAIAIDPSHALGHFWRGMLACELGIDGRPSLTTFVKLAANAPSLAASLAQARTMLAAFGARPKLPPGRPGPTMLEAVSTGGPAQAFCFQAPSVVLPAGQVLVVSWMLDVPVREARALKVTPMVSAGVCAHGISTALEAAVGCFEEEGLEIDDVLDGVVLRAWTAVVASRRIAKVTFVGNKPWSARVRSDVAKANEELARRGIGGDPITLHGASSAQLDALLAAFVGDD